MKEKLTKVPFLSNNNAEKNIIDREVKKKFKKKPETKNMTTTLPSHTTIIGSGGNNHK